MNTEFKGFIKKLPNILFVLLTVAVLLFSLIRTAFFPKDINYYENRYSEKIIAPNAENVLDQTFQDSIENSLADQIPKAQALKKVYNTLTSKYIDSIIEPIIESNPDIYINYLGVKLFGSDQIVYSYKDLDDLKPALEAKAENYNKLFEKYPDLEFYAYFLEKDTDMNFETEEKVGASKYMLDLLKMPDNNKTVFEINSYKDFRETFYKTDHHWNHKGSYKAYTEILDLLGIKSEPIKPLEEKLISKDFSGSKAASAGAGMFKEDFYAYRFEYPEFKITLNGKEAEDYGAQDKYFSDNKPSSISYGGFYGWDDGEIIIDNGNEQLDNILVIGESYDNAILKLLASHHNLTYSIDLRNYEYYMDKKFNFADYNKTHKIDKVLFVGNIDFFIKEEFMLEND